MTDYDLKFNSSPVCPYCGSEMTDAWELEMDDGDADDVDCGVCCETYAVVCHVQVTYSTGGDR